MIKNKFESAEQDEDELTGILKQLKDIGFINIFWADDIPYDVKLEYLGKTYFETAKSIKKTERVIEPRIGSVYTGNMVVGDVINSSLSNSTNITFIENRIDAEGGEDKEELRELLKEAKEAIENFQESGEIKENENFSKKARRHLEKYPWFYSGLMNLMGTAAMKIFLGS
jgi:ribosomal protein S20